MPINEQLIAQRLNAFIRQNLNNDNVEEATQNFSREIASIIVEAIKSGDIIISPGEIVTVGSAATQTNTSPISLKIQ
jgi:hypothetical protein